MLDTINNKALVLDLVEWVAREPRRYADVMGAWRTSCPRLTIWEDAIDHGLVVRAFDGTTGAIVEVTPAGSAFLHAEGRQ
ncbi:MAG TPA: hypothetical protein VH951_05415 [Dehalococcoidia bacterium]|jgi:hypothetical protein